MWTCAYVTGKKCESCDVGVGPQLRFTVDAYHYINHQVADYLCWKYCNPSPGDASAPNLVVMAYDKNGRPYLK